MKDFENIIITNINKPITVFSEKGRFLEMKNRPYYGLSFCAEGKIVYTSNGKEYVSDPQHIVFLPKGGNYTLRGVKQGYFPLINFDCEYFPINDFLCIPVENSDEFIKDYENLQHLFLFKMNRLKIMSFFYHLLHKIFQMELPKKNTLLPAIKYVENNIGNPNLNNDDLAREMGISEIYLRKQFLKEYGVTPKQFILHIRMEKAKQLLSDATLSVTAIAADCGFSSVYHFCRIFKQKTGITPTEYMTQNRTYQI